MVKRGRSQHGFSLVEAIAAMVVIAIAAPTSLVFLHDAARARADAALSIRAAWLAQCILDEGAADAASPNPAINFGAMANTRAYERELRNRLEQSIGDPGAAFDMEWSIVIEPVAVAPMPGGYRAIAQPGLADPDYRRLQVTVQWTNARGDEQRLVVESVVAKP